MPNISRVKDFCIHFSFKLKTSEGKNIYTLIMIGAKIKFP